VGITIQQGMAVASFSVGILATVAGIGMILAREYQQALRILSQQSKSLHAKALTEVGIVPVLDASAKLVSAVTQLIRTAMGVGAFLCLVGIALCLIGFWMISASPVPS
jgi:hypothetical protein